jgi:hypothetical protein
MWNRNLLVLALLFLVGPMCPAHADTLVDQFYAGFVGNAKFAIESDTDGRTRPGFHVNYIEIGNLKGGHIAAIDLGLGGTILPETAKFSGAEWSSGGKLHLAPIIKNYVNLPAGAEFLGNLELDFRGSYNWSLHHPFYGIVCAYPFR